MKTATRSCCATIVASFIVAVGASPAIADEPCCKVVSVDAASQRVTIQPRTTRKAMFELTVADAAQLRKVAKGQAVSLSGSSLTLLLHGDGTMSQSIKLTNVRYVPVTGKSSETGAVASAASSTSSGDFRRDAPTGGRCPAIKETPGEQCVLTHDNTGSGRGCDYFCVPTNR